MARSGDLSEAQMLAWRRFLRAHALVTRRLEGDLLAEQNLPLASYDVLVQLVEAPTRRLRMSELAERALLSRSGLTHLVGLEGEGLVQREACQDDARSLFTVLTDDGSPGCGLPAPPTCGASPSTAYAARPSATAAASGFPVPCGRPAGWRISRR